MKTWFDEFKYQLAIALLALLFMIVAFINILHPRDILYITKFNLWKDIFREPVESVVFLFRDGDGYIFSTHHENIVNTYPESFLEEFKRENKDTKDILVIVHNHLNIARFTSGNKAVERYFRNKGIEVPFGIYYPHSGKTIFLENKTR